MREQRVAIEMQDHVADVRLTRGDKMNALDPAMFDAHHRRDSPAGRRCRGCARSCCRARAARFAPGSTWRAWRAADRDIDLDTRDARAGQSFPAGRLGLATLPVPVIAAVHGVAFGGGLQIASGADMRIAAPGTRLSVMEIKWGIVPDMAGYALWRGCARRSSARAELYRARVPRRGGADARLRHAGIADDPHAEAMALAPEIAARNPHAIRAAKRLANLEGDAAATLVAETAEQAALLRTPNQIEAVMANMQKRAPDFAD